MSGEDRERVAGAAGPAADERVGVQGEPGAMEAWLGQLGPGGGVQSPGSVLALQRSAGNQAVRNLLDHVAPPAPPPLARAPGPVLAREAEVATAGRPLLVDPGGQAGPGQLPAGEFLDLLEPALCEAAEQELPAPFTAAGCPWIAHWLGRYRTRPAADIEAAIRRYAPRAASADEPRDLITAVCDRVRDGIAQWRTTGSLAGVPPELANEAASGGGPATAGGGSEAGSPAATTGDATVGSPAATTGGAVARSPAAATSGGVVARSPADDREGDSSPAAVQDRLGAGRALDGGARARFERAFARDFSAVRVHDDHAVARSLHARAVTVGRDIVFGADQYAPGTLLGDALIAHELAHVVQQDGATLQRAEDGGPGAEQDANEAALAALTGARAAPAVRSGLALNRCGLTDEPERVNNDAILANAPRVTGDTRFQEGDVPGQMPTSESRRGGGARIRIDGDGDQMKELEVYVIPASHYPGGDRVREMTVQVTQISSQQSRTARFTLPDSQTGNGTSWPVVRSVTDGHDPTEISLVLPMGVKVLRIQPGQRSATGVSYALELAAREFAHSTDAWTVDQRQQLDFPPDAGPRRVFEVSGPAATTPGGQPGPRQVGDIWALDLTAGPYGDRFRLSFRRPQGSADRVDMGVSVLDAVTGEPQGGETIPLAHTGPLSVAMLANDGISAAIDLNGDGRPDVQVFDRLTQRDEDYPGPPGVNRNHELQVLGPAVSNPRRLLYAVHDGTITAGRVRPHAEDLAAAENASAFSGLDQQAGLTDAAAEIESLDLQLSQLREAAHRDGIIGDELFQAWQTLSLGFVTLRFARRQGAVPDDLRDRLAAEARAFYVALSAATSRAGESNNPYTGSGDNGRVCIDAGANFVAAIRNGDWSDAARQFRTLVRGMDRWIMEQHRARYPSNVEGRPETQRAGLMEQMYGRRDLISGIAHRNPTRIRAVYHPSAGYESRGRIAQVPLSLYFWRDSDGEDWIIKDTTTTQESPEYEGDGRAGELEPSLTAMQALDNDDHFQAGFINYVMPSGAGGRVETTGPSRVVRWLTLAGLATAAIGLGLLTAGAGTAAVTFLGISGLIGATTAGIDLVQRSRTNTLTIRTALLDVAQIAAGLAGGGALAAGRILNGARLAAAAGEAVQATAALRAANAMWVPLQIGTGVGEAAQGIIMVEGAYHHLQQIQNSSASQAEKERALFTFLTELAVTTGLVVLSVRGSSAEVFAGRPLSIEVVNGVHYAVPATRSVQGRAIDQSREALDSATADAAAVRQQQHLENIRTTLPGREGEALASVEAMALRPAAEGDLVADSAGNLFRGDRPAGTIDDLVDRVARANNAGAAHGTSHEYRVAVEAAGAGGRSRVRVTASARGPLDAGATAQQLVASTEGALQAAGPVTRRIRGLDPSVRIETTPGGALKVEGHPDLDLPRLTRELGGAAQLDTLAGQLGAPLARIASDLPGPEVVTLVSARGASAVRWAGTELPGQRARQLLDGLSADVLRRCRLAVTRGGVTPTQAETLLDVLGDANLQRCVGNVHMRELVPLVAQQERGAARRILEGYLNAGQIDSMRRFLRSAERAAAVELASPAAVGAADIIVDNQTLSSVRALLGGQSWANLQQIERRMVEHLFTTLGSPLSPTTLAPTGRGPTQAQLEGIMPRLRAPATVLGETGINARHRPPGGTTIELGPVERPVGLDIGVERNSPEYRAILDELERPRPRPWTSAADIDPTTGRTEAVGKPGGIRDRTVVADALFAEAVPGSGPRAPRFFTADGAVFERLAGYATSTVNPPGTGPGKLPARLARANPDGFEVTVLGRRLWIVPVGL